jgi:hypothetical protein
VREYLVRVRHSGDDYTATIRRVHPDTPIDAVTTGTETIAVARTAPAAIVAAVAAAHIPVVPADKLLRRIGERHEDTRRFKPTHAGYPTVTPPDDLASPQEARTRPTGPAPRWDYIRELLVMWPAWQEIVRYVSLSEPSDADPQSIYGAVCGHNRDRIGALLYAHHFGDTLPEAAAILTELLAAARDGHRPRTGPELGLTPEMFESGDA